MIDKIVDTLEAAVAGIADGATVLVGGFGSAGIPGDLVAAVIARAPRGLTIVSNNAGAGDDAVSRLLASGLVRRLICSYPRSQGSHVFQALYDAGDLELELVPQGTLSERMRAAGAGIGGFYTRTAAGTLLAEGKETRLIDGDEYVLEKPLHADVALLRAHKADRWGNLVYRATARNLNPVMAMAARLSVVQVDEVVELGGLDPETVVTPGIFIDRVVRVARAAP